jgi:predicted DNA-binding transcriptional regulator AlpA
MSEELLKCENVRPEGRAGCIVSPVSNSAQPEKPVYSPRELAQRCGVSLKAITNWTQSRRIPGQVKIGHAWRYDRQAVERAMRSGNFLMPSPRKVCSNSNA